MYNKNNNIVNMEKKVKMSFEAKMLVANQGYPVNSNEMVVEDMKPLIKALENTGRYDFSFATQEVAIFMEDREVHICVNGKLATRVLVKSPWSGRMLPSSYETLLAALRSVQGYCELINRGNETYVYTYASIFNSFAETGDCWQTMPTIVDAYICDNKAKEESMKQREIDMATDKAAWLSMGYYIVWESENRLRYAKKIAENEYAIVEYRTADYEHLADIELIERGTTPEEAEKEYNAE